jgi:transcriptional regulator with XRE-family HTH domain
VPCSESYTARHIYASNSCNALPKKELDITPGRFIAAQRRRLQDGQGRVTQKRLAELVGVSPRTVVAWENDQRKPSGESLVALSRVLDVEPEIILHPPIPVKPMRSARHGEGAGAVTREWSGFEGPDEPIEDPAAYTPYDRMADFLDRHGLRRVVRELTPRALLGMVGALYQAGIQEGWPEDEMRELERLRRDLSAEAEQGREEGPGGR